jgi:sugar (pentulose or hexulose) kinase
VTLVSEEGPAFGAALLAGVGSEVYSSVDDAVKRTVREAQPAYAWFVKSILSIELQLGQ